MEKNEELLERLVNEFAAQNKLIALQIAFQKNAHKRGYFKDDDEYYANIEKDSLYIYDKNHSEILDTISSTDSDTSNSEKLH